MQNVDLSLIGALGAAVATLGGVVAYMGKWFMAQFESVRAEVVECRKDREKLWERLADLNRKIENK
jgi:hypothetical protein